MHRIIIFSLLLLAGCSSINTDPEYTSDVDLENVRKVVGSSIFSMKLIGVHECSRERNRDLYMEAIKHKFNKCFVAAKQDQHNRSHFQYTVVFKREGQYFLPAIEAEEFYAVR